LGALVRVAIFLTKTFVVILFFMLVRWSWPRFRFDQLMALAWKVMLPLGIVNLFVIAILEQCKNSFVQAYTGPGAAAWLMILPAWLVAVIAWWCTALAGPQISDNRSAQRLRRAPMQL
jgi:NADH-quinone oxidoreductase subunit H